MRTRLTLLSWTLLLLTSAEAPAQPPAKTARLDAVGDPLPAGALARLGTLRLRTGQSITATALSPDGKVFAVSAQSEGVRLLDAATGKELRRVGKPEAAAMSLAFAPDGKLLAAVEDAENVQLWDTATGAAGHKLNAPQLAISSVLFSGDGKFLAACTDASPMKTPLPVWDVAAGKLAASLAVLPNQQQRAALSADGKLLAVCGQYRANPGDTEKPEEVMQTVQLWDVKAGKELRRLKAERGSFTNVAFAPDGKTLAATLGTCTLTFWDVAAGKELRRCATRRGIGSFLAYSPDGKSLAAATDDAVQLWDAATGKRLGQYEGIGSSLPRARFTPDGKVLVHGNTDKAVFLYDLLARKPLTPTTGHTDAVLGLAFRAGGKELVSASADGLICVWDAATGKEARRLRVRDDADFVGPIPSVPVPGLRAAADAGNVVVSPGGKYLLAGSFGSLRLYDAGTGEQVLALEDDESVAGSVADFSADGSLFAVAQQREGPPVGAVVLRVYEVATGRRLHEVTGPAGQALGVALSPDGKVLAAAIQPNAAAGPSSELHVWDVTTGKERWRAKRTGEAARAALAFAPDGKLLATAGETGAVTLWDGAAGRELRGLTTPGADATTALLFSPDGRLLAAGYAMAGNKPPRVRVWELATGTVRHEFTGHKGEVAALAFAPDGKRLATGATDTTALLWDLTGRAGEEAPKGKPTAEELDKLWAGLGETDGRAGFKAMRRLSDAPEEAVALVKKQVKPAEAGGADARTIAKLIAGLDADDFDEREKAAKALEKLGKAAEGALTKALAGGPSAEAKRRIDELLGKLQDKGAPPPEWVRPLRAVEVLENLATPEAAKLLGELAKGDPDAPLTAAAKAALGRLERAAKP